MNVHRQTLERIGLRVAAEQDRELAHDHADTDVLMSGIARRRRAANVRRGVAVATFASALVAVVVFMTGALRSVPVIAAAPPAPHVAPVQPALGERVAATEDVPLAFADGTAIAVKRGASADVRAVSEHGATIALERGTLAVHVVHHDTSRWDIVAGKFGIRVTGTKFDATWDPDAKKLTVAMSEGSVRVTGPCVDEPLAAPNTKTFSCADEAPPATSMSVDSLPSAARPASVEIETASKLIEKADAARLSGDAATARRLYSRVRERFPKSAESAKAAFLLGRLAESAGSADEAVKWYETVVRETPRDAYAQEALGRTLALEQGRGNVDRARTLANDYLRKHPNGPYRAYATSVLDAR